MHQQTQWYFALISFINIKHKSSILEEVIYYYSAWPEKAQIICVHHRTHFYSFLKFHYHKWWEGGISLYTVFILVDALNRHLYGCQVCLFCCSSYCSVREHGLVKRCKENDWNMPTVWAYQNCNTISFQRQRHSPQWCWEWRKEVGSWQVSTIAVTSVIFSQSIYHHCLMWSLPFPSVSHLWCLSWREDQVKCMYTLGNQTISLVS